MQNGGGRLKGGKREKVPLFSLGEKGKKRWEKGGFPGAPKRGP